MTDRRAQTRQQCECEAAIFDEVGTRTNGPIVTQVAGPAQQEVRGVLVTGPSRDGRP